MKKYKVLNKDGYILSTVEADLMKSDDNFIYLYRNSPNHTPILIAVFNKECSVFEEKSE